MLPTVIRLALACAAGGICGAFVGGVVSIACASSVCPALDPPFLWAGAIVGAGVVALSVASARPDPRACNRQDPPFGPAA